MERDPNKVTAFPVPVGQTCDDFQGMTLRDYFAGQAMAAILSRRDLTLLYQQVDGDDSWMPEWNGWSTSGTPVEIISAHGVTARMAYEMADAMIVARGGEPGGSS